jgi:hypothetical protein
VTEPPGPTNDLHAPSLGRTPPRRGVHPLLKVVLATFALSASSCVACLVGGYRAQAGGRAYADDVLPRISQPWDAEAVVQRATPEFLSNMPKEKVATFVSFLASRLGTLKHPSPFQDSSWRSVVGTQGFIVTTVQFADCEFEKASARITLTLVRQGGVWRINGLHANADVLMQ